MTDLHGQFRIAAEDAQSHVLDARSASELAAWCRGLAADGRVIVAPATARAEPALIDALVVAGLDVEVPDASTRAVDVADSPLGIVMGELAVAETGSVLVSEHDVGDRLVTLLVRHLVQVVARDAVVPSLDDVAVWLLARAGQAGFASLMTGPSRSADIERSLSIGVQGPEDVTVAVLR